VKRIFRAARDGRTGREILEENMTKQHEKTESLSHADLQIFTGDIERYQHWNRRVIYTPGVKFLAEQGEAYWLIDAIASYFSGAMMWKAMAKDDRLSSLQFWRLDVHPDCTAVLTARADSGVTPFVSQQIPYTDFPLSSVDVWAGFDGRHWTLYLPSEH
jgi:hypothetical protein